jgi:hypothetical protein
MTGGFFINGVLDGWLLAYWLHFRLTDAELLRRQMDRIVNIEAIEERERLLKFRMARQGLRSTRLDGGPNARVMRMRIGPRPRMGR